MLRSERETKWDGSQTSRKQASTNMEVCISRLHCPKLLAIFNIAYVMSLLIKNKYVSFSEA